LKDEDDSVVSLFFW